MAPEYLHWERQRRSDTVGKDRQVVCEFSSWGSVFSRVEGTICWFDRSSSCLEPWLPIIINLRFVVLTS